MLSTVFRIYRLHVVLVMVAGVFFAFATPVDAASVVASVSVATEAVHAFDASIVVQPDGRVVVEERIVYAFPEERHGIFRELPDTYRDEAGTRYHVPVTVLDVMDGLGAAVPYRVSSASGMKRLRIGDPDATVRGEQTYVLRYEVAGAVRYFDEHDELYWNVTGSAWEVPLRSASATVALPEGVPRAEVRVRCFAGSASNSSDATAAGECDAVRGADAATGAPTAHFTTTDGALTIVVGWPKGHVAVLAARRSSAPFALPQLWPLLLPCAALAVLTALWRHHGRDEGQRPGARVVQYGPPGSARPADLGALVNERARTRDIIATIVDLAVRGHLRIEETERMTAFGGARSEFRFVDLRGAMGAAMDGDLAPYERSILEAMFDATAKRGKLKTSVTLTELASRHAFYETSSAITTAMLDRAVALGWFAARPDAVRVRYYGTGGGVAVAGIILGAVAVGAGLGFAGAIAGIAVLLTGVVIAGFAPLMPRRTEAGSAALAHTEGFREYLEKAEKYRLRWQEHQGMFERYLPYALALGVADRYATAFASLGFTPPDSGWYAGPALTAGGVFDARRFSVSLAAFSRGASDAVASIPASTSSGSGFSGGGSMGGGFGGGGGGSW